MGVDEIGTVPVLQLRLRARPAAVGTPAEHRPDTRDVNPVQPEVARRRPVPRRPSKQPFEIGQLLDDANLLIEQALRSAELLSYLYSSSVGYVLVREDHGVSLSGVAWVAQSFGDLIREMCALEYLVGCDPEEHRSVGNGIRTAVTTPSCATKALPPVCYRPSAVHADDRVGPHASLVEALD